MRAPTYCQAECCQNKLLAIKVGSTNITWVCLRVAGNLGLHVYFSISLSEMLIVLAVLAYFFYLYMVYVYFLIFNVFTEHCDIAGIVVSTFFPYLGLNLIYCRPYFMLLSSFLFLKFILMCVDRHERAAIPDLTAPV